MPSPQEEPYAGAEVDLTREGPQLEFAALQADTYDPNPKREQVRGTIAWFLLGILAFTILFAFMAVARQWTDYDNIKDMLARLQRKDGFDKDSPLGTSEVLHVENTLAHVGSSQALEMLAGARTKHDHLFHCLTRRLAHRSMASTSKGRMNFAAVIIKFPHALLT